MKTIDDLKKLDLKKITNDNLAEKVAMLIDRHEETKDKAGFEEKQAKNIVNIHGMIAKFFPDALPATKAKEKKTPAKPTSKTGLKAESFKGKIKTIIGRINEINALYDGEDAKELNSLIQPVIDRLKEILSEHDHNESLAAAIKDAFGFPIKDIEGDESKFPQIKAVREIMIDLLDWIDLYHDGNKGAKSKKPKEEQEKKSSDLGSFNKDSVRATHDELRKIEEKLTGKQQEILEKLNDGLAIALAIDSDSKFKQKVNVTLAIFKDQFQHIKDPKDRSEVLMLVNTLLELMDKEIIVDLSNIVPKYKKGQFITPVKGNDRAGEKAEILKVKIGKDGTADIHYNLLFDDGEKVENMLEGLLTAYKFSEEELDKEVADLDDQFAHCKQMMKEYRAKVRAATPPKAPPTRLQKLKNAAINLLKLTPPDKLEDESVRAANRELVDLILEKCIENWGMRASVENAQDAVAKALDKVDEKMEVKERKAIAKEWRESMSKRKERLLKKAKDETEEKEIRDNINLVRDAISLFDDDPNACFKQLQKLDCHDRADYIPETVLDMMSGHK